MAAFYRRLNLAVPLASVLHNGASGQSRVRSHCVVPLFLETEAFLLKLIKLSPFLRLGFLKLRIFLVLLLYIPELLIEQTGAMDWRAVIRAKHRGA